MNRALQNINLFGVLVLAALCVFQWRINRQLNLQANQLEKNRIAQAIQIEDHEKTIKGYAADLDTFREQLQSTAKNLKTSEEKLRMVQHGNDQLVLERDHLKENLLKWTEAVQARDEQLAYAREQIQSLADARNDAVSKFNELAERYNVSVGELNSRTEQFNALVEKYNTLAKAGASNAGK